MEKNRISFYAVFVSALTALGMLHPYALEAGNDVRPGGSRSSQVQEYIDRKMGEEPFRSGIAGVLAVTLEGDTLAEYGSMRKMIPASNTKLITTGLAMNALGPGFRFTTGLGYAGHVSGGVLHGDLYIVGGGDPTIASGDAMALQRDSLFAKWKKALADAGIRRISGLIIGDGRYFDGPIENENWSYNDLGTDYGAGGNGLCFSRNVLTVNAEPTSAGERVRASAAYPSAPWMTFRVNAFTSPAGTGDNLYLFNTDMVPVSELRGSLAVDKGVRKEQCSNKFGAMTCAWYFHEYLRGVGIASDGAADVDPYGNIREAASFAREPLAMSSRPAAEPSSLHIIGSFRSPSLYEIAKVTNARSDNFYAETLLRILSKKRTGSASYDSCSVVVLRELDSLGTDVGSGLRMVDGSGLARHNYISPGFFCRFLSAMAGSDVASQYLSTLSVAGGSRMKNAPEALRRRVRMKSGSMDGVLCYSGYILPAARASSAAASVPPSAAGEKSSVTASSGAAAAGKSGGSASHGSSAVPEGTIVFSIMTNNITENAAEVRRFIDTLLIMLCAE